MTPDDVTEKEGAQSYALAQEMDKHRWASNGNPQERFNYICICGETYHSFKSHVADVVARAAITAYESARGDVKPVIEWGVEYEVDNGTTVYEWGVDELEAKRLAANSPTDTAVVCRAVLTPAPEPTVKPDRETVATAISDAEGFLGDPSARHYELADAALAKWPGRSEREVKAEALNRLRQEMHDWAFNAGPDSAFFAAVWEGRMRDRATALEEGQTNG